MAVIYLQHPVHGAKVAISEMEAENDIQNGWEEFDPNDVSEPENEPVKSVDFEPELAEPMNQLPRRRGRRHKEDME
jgi:hypothetical protein